MNKKTIIITIVVIAGALIYGFFFRAGNTEDFVSAYAAYDTVSDAHAAAAYVPGGGNNSARRKLNGILPRVLSEGIAEEERLRLSEEALVSVGEIRSQVGAVGTEGKKAESAFNTLRTSSEEVTGFFAGRQARNIVALAEERARTIKDIEEILYGINDQLESIFQGIIADRGALTAERINILNQDLPKAEKQFDTLTASYKKLDELTKSIDEALSTFRSQS